MPKCDKYHAKWKANMAKCSKYHAKCKVTMPKCSKYHAKWQVLVPNCCKYKANGTGKESQKKSKTWGKKNPKTILHPYIVGWVGSWIRCVASGRRTMSKCISVRIFICKCHLMSFAHIHKRTQFWVYIYNMHLNK